ncbi:MAG: glycosyltransferase [Pseudomonadota bacterium]
MPAKRPHCSLIAPSFEGGGAERVTINLANALAADGVDVELAVLASHGPFRSEVAPEVRVRDLGIRRVSAGFPKLVRYFRELRPPVLLSALDYINVAAIWANQIAGSPAQVHVGVHNHATIGLRTSEHWRDRVLMRSAIRASYGRAASVITLTEAMADDLAELSGLSCGHITVLPNVVLTGREAAARAEATEHPWAQDAERPLIVGIGRLHEQKNFPALIDAFAPLAQDSRARLVILGEGPERPALAAMVADLGLGDAVDLPGFAKNPHALLARASLFVLSSRHEGLPTVLIEAMAAGCPVVATDCPTGPAEILQDGALGRLVPVDDVGALRLAMRETLATPVPAERLIARAEDYSASRVVSLYRAHLGL